MPRSAGVERSKTSYPTMNTDFYNLTPPRMAESMSAGLTRKHTQITPARPSPNATIGGPHFGDSSKHRPGAHSSHVPSNGAHFKSN